MGHVQQKPGGFQTGPAVAKDLRLKAQFQRDALLVSRVCEHPPEDEDEDLPLGACRGLVQDFPTSKISKQSKATRYLKASPQEQQSMQESAKENCTFCSAPLFPLSGNTFFEDNLAPCEESEFEEFFRESSPETFERVTGNVCGKGHLTFAINHYGDCLQILQNKPIMGTGEQLWVETFKVFKAMVEAFEGELDSDTEIDFRKNLDAFTVSRKLRRLAAEIEYEVSDEEDTLEELRPLARLQTMPELINGVPEIARRTCKLIKDFEDGCEDSFESESEFESEEEEEFDDVRPFWEVPADEIDVVRDFLSTMSKDWVGILATYLGRKMLSARTLLSTVRQLEQLNSIGEQATHRLAEMEAHRKAVIEGALEEAGVCKRAGAWPIPEAVYKFVKDPNTSLEETVNRERQRWLELEETRAKRRAEHNAREAERKAQRDQEKAAKQASRASQGMIVCPGSANGTKCNNAGSDACVRLACGACCHTYSTEGCRRHRRR